MPIIANAKQREWQLPPPGMYAAVCVDVEDHGMVLNQKYGKEQHECRFVWQINCRMDDGRLFIVSRKFTVSLSEKSHLLPFIQGWFGRPLTTEELNELDLEKLVGSHCILQILHNPSKDGQKIYANVTQIMPLMAGTPPVQPEAYTRYKDRQPQQAGAGQTGPIDSTQTQRFQQSPNRQGQAPPPPPYQQQQQQQQGQQQAGGPYASTPQAYNPPSPPVQLPPQQPPPHQQTGPIQGGYDPRIDEIPF